MATPNLSQLQYDYEMILSKDATITNVPTAYTTLINAITAIGATTGSIDTASLPIINYYNDLLTINTNLQTYLTKASENIVDLETSEERYKNKIYPEESVLPRESTYGIIPELRIQSVPYLLAISVFMASLSIFLIFQMFGFSGQVNLPPSITAWLSSPASTVPFYMNPMILGGVIILLLVTVIIFIGLYIKSKNSNKN